MGQFEQSFSCPRCGHNMDSYTSFKDPAAAPKTGDVAICIKCQGVFQYDIGDTVKLVEASAEAVASVMLELSKYQNALRAIKEI